MFGTIVTLIVGLLVYALFCKTNARVLVSRKSVVGQFISGGKKGLETLFKEDKE
jgi:hypothetical protein